MDTRIEILKNDKWQALRLSSDVSIKYNRVINKIGNVASREISHTNTFSLPYVYQNINILGLNNFNPRQMAKAMNTKYLSRYYVEEKLVQDGYLVINNANEGVIKVNFIDEALSLVELWGTMTYEELLRNEELDIPVVYADAIAEMRSYELDKNAEVDHLGEVSGKGFGIAVFPNNLNQIGDKFQISTVTDERVDGVYNPYQCRPVYNVMAFMDMITESFGYTPTYDPSINWDLLETTFMSTEEPQKNKKDEGGGEQTEVYPTISSVQRYKYRVNTSGNFVNTLFQPYSEQSVTVNEIPNFVRPIDMDSNIQTAFTYRDAWMDEYTVFQPNDTTGNAGTIRWRANVGSGTWIPKYTLRFIWKNEVFGQAPLVDKYTSIGINHTEIEVNSGITSLDGTYTRGTFSGRFDNNGGASLQFYTGGDFIFFYMEVNPTTWAVLGKQQTNGIYTGNTDGGNWAIALTNTSPVLLNSDVSNFAVNWETFDHYEIGPDQFLMSGLYYGPTTPTGDITYPIDEPWDGSGGPFEIGTTAGLDITMDKTFLDRIPNRAGDFIGVILDYGQSFSSSVLGGLSAMQITETYIPEGVIVYDDEGQYIPTLVDMTHGASKKTLKKLVSSIMHKEGILMDINAKLKTVKFFSYAHYKAQREAGNFSDWSDLIMEYDPIIRNTDFGNKYAKKNRIGLSSPFNGNTYDLNLDNQGSDSKYKDFTENYVSGFKDVENIKFIDNTGTTTDYFEYTLKGLGLVESDGEIGLMDQQRADPTTGYNGPQTNEIPIMANVNYGQLPYGVESWYKLIDQALKVEAKFLLPIDAFRNLDMSQPVYVEQLGGFYIIEEVSQYTNGSTPVSIKLIKLINTFTDIDTGEGGGDDEGNTEPSFVIDALYVAPIPGIIFTHSMGIYSSITYFTPTSAEVIARRFDANPDTDGTASYIGPTITLPITVNEFNEGIYTQIYSYLTMQSSHEGWWEIQGSAFGEVSEERSANFNSGPDIGPQPDLYSNIEYLWYGDGNGLFDGPTTDAREDKAASSSAGEGKAVFNYSTRELANATTTDTYVTWEKKDSPTALQTASGASGAISGGSVSIILIDSTAQDTEEKTVTIDFGEPGLYDVTFSTAETSTKATTLEGIYVD